MVYCELSLLLLEQTGLAACNLTARQCRDIAKYIESLRSAAEEVSDMAGAGLLRDLAAERDANESRQFKNLRAALSPKRDTGEDDEL